MKQPRLETRPNKNSSKHYTCTHVFPELTAVCPVTRLPDFYTVTISYEPDMKLVELKSLKLYFAAYRNVEILHEEITNRILDDLIKTLEPRWATIRVDVNNRGGITTTITRSWSKDLGDEVLKPEQKIERAAT
jgi:7-cyano-7-deazaguanine reductase